MAAASDFNPFQAPPKGPNTFAQITDNVTRIMEAPKPPKAWYVAFAIALGMLTMFLGSITWAAWNGIGVWGNMMPVAWAFPIVNFVFWIGIGHAGTLISAVLFLFRQNWRTAINRFAEAMTIFAVMCAGIFPGVHIGRPWLPYYMMPIPNQMGMWPQYRSPLEWDIFAVSTYATVSILFWYMGMIPDFATFRDKSTSTAKRIAYGIVAMGWRGSSRQWHRYERAYLILAALATPLVLSVHSVVSFDFATAQLPGWHATIFPPYFVAGAIFGGFAMVVVLAVPARQFFGLKRIITIRHLELMNKIMIATGLLVGGIFIVGYLLGLRGVSGRGLIVVLGLIALYFVLRFVVFRVGMPTLLARDAGFGFHRYDAADIDRMFGGGAAGFYSYNVLVSVMGLLFAEPRDGVFALTRSVVQGSPSLPLLIGCVSSTLATALMARFAWVRRHAWRRWQLDRRDQLVLLFVGVAAGNAAISYAYTKDTIMSPAGFLYAAAVFVACRDLVERLTTGERRRLVHAAGVAVLLVLSVTWSIRMVGLHAALTHTAYHVREEWAHVDETIARMGYVPVPPDVAAVKRQLQGDAIVVHPGMPELREGLVVLFEVD